MSGAVGARPAMSADPLQEYLRAAAAWAAYAYPHLRPKRVCLEFEGTELVACLPMILPPSLNGQPRPAEPPEELVEEKGPPVSPVVVDILGVIEESPKPLTQYGVCAALARKKIEWSQRTVAGYLAEMVRQGVLVNPPGVKPAGYRLPE